ncbi:acyl-CoA dehydrogenase family protein [Cupriavidus necator]|uniref:acyl-CoA dehydrogenase family protein n=1 Tax=Cupriavidus necator TaxID=106590 RepID=UPI0005B53692|nr:acyl-CoA dehydrogenase family protein [Cupriavidus necator]
MPSATGDPRWDRYIKPFIDGRIRFSVSISEPDAGSDASSTKTRARREENGDWIVSGQKLWCSGAAAKDTVIAMLVAIRDGKEAIDLGHIENAARTLLS